VVPRQPARDAALRGLGQAGRKRARIAGPQDEGGHDDRPSTRTRHRRRRDAVGEGRGTGTAQAGKPARGEARERVAADQKGGAEEGHDDVRERQQPTQSRDRNARRHEDRS
jgi:hypothetical protein